MVMTTLCSITGEQFHQLYDYQLLKDNSASCEGQERTQHDYLELSVQ
jgi:hypothetical protein